MPCMLLQVRTAWKVWQTWADNTRDLRLTFDDTNVQWLARQLVKSERVRGCHSLPGAFQEQLQGAGSHPRVSMSHVIASLVQCRIK